MITPRDGELLSAYLSGDLDDAEAQALEARLADEPGLAARLEQTRAVLEGLARLDEVTPPEGYEARLRARLAAEPGAPASLEAARARRDERRRAPWPALGAVAAGVAGVAVLGALLTGQLGGLRDMEVAEGPVSDEAADEPEEDAEPEEAAEPEMEFEAFEDAAEEDADSPERSLAAPAPSAPEIRDVDAELAGADEAIAYLSGTRAEGLLGTPVDEGADLAAAFGVAVRRAPAFDSGLEPGGCVEIVSAGADQPVVVAQAESVVYEGSAGVAYVVATASSGAPVLDRVEAWVLDAACGTRLFADVTPE